MVIHLPHGEGMGEWTETEEPRVLERTSDRPCADADRELQATEAQQPSVSLSMRPERGCGIGIRYIFICGVSGPCTLSSNVHSTRLGTALAVPRCMDCMIPVMASESSSCSDCTI